MRVVSNDARYVVVFTSEPTPIPLNEPFGLNVQVLDARRDLEVVTDAEITVDAAMPGHGHGMNVVPRVWKNNDHTVTVSNMLFHMPGHWELYFDITRRGRTERAQVDIELD